MAESLERKPGDKEPGQDLSGADDQDPPVPSSKRGSPPGYETDPKTGCKTNGKTYSSHSGRKANPCSKNCTPSQKIYCRQTHLSRKRVHNKRDPQCRQNYRYANWQDYYW